MTEISKYPIVPYEGEWGADIAVNGKPEWLPDRQVCAIFEQEWIGADDGGLFADDWNWLPVTKIRLPASHGYYAKYGRVHTDSSRSGGQPAFNLDTWQSETKANLPAIEAAGHKVELAADWALELAHTLLAANSVNDMADHIRKTVRPIT